MFVVLMLCASADLVWQPRPDDSLIRLAKFLSEQSTVVMDAQLLADEQEGQLAHSRVYPNPNLHLKVGQIPVGDTNPTGLRPGDQVMTYGVSLDYKFELNKRGYRQEHNRWLLNARKAHVANVLRKEAVALGRTLVHAAILQIVREGIAVPADAKGDDKAMLAIFAMRDQMLAYDADLQRALGECSTVVGLKCQPFVSTADARAFLDRWLSSVPGGDDGIERSWEVREIDAERHAADAAKSLYGAGIIPDPTLSFGYLHDRLQTGGNQQNTFTVGLSIPLSFFDRGQAQEQAASAMSSRLKLQQQKALDQGKEAVRAQRATLDAERKRLTQFETEVLPRAKALWTRALAGSEDHMLAQRVLADATRTQTECLKRVFDSALALLEQLPE